jgi:hypothetical protein
MKASILLVLICAILASAVSFAADDAERPAGVEAENWLPISDRLGFVVVPVAARRWSIATGVAR